METIKCTVVGIFALGLMGLVVWLLDMGMTFIVTHKQVADILANIGKGILWVAVGAMAFLVCYACGYFLLGYDEMVNLRR